MRNLQNKCFVLIPAFGEAQALSGVLTRLVQTFETFNIRGEALIVHDGNASETNSLIRQIRAPFPIRTLLRGNDQGLGQAIQRGFELLMLDARMDDVVVVMNANRSYDSQLIARMIGQINEGSDVVIAPRHNAQNRTTDAASQLRNWTWFANTYNRLRSPELNRLDQASGFRAYRAEFIKTALSHYGQSFLQRSGAEALSEVLMKLKRFYPMIYQIPSISRDRATTLPKRSQVRKTSGLSIGLHAASLL